MKRIPLLLSIIAGITASISMQSCQPSEQVIAPSARQAVVTPPDSITDPTGNYSAWTTVNFSPTGSGTTYSGTMPAADITDDYLDNSRVAVYMRNGEKTLRLPVTIYINGVSHYVYAVTHVGQIEIISSGELSSRKFQYAITPSSSVPAVVQ